MLATSLGPSRVVLKTDPEACVGEAAMEFRLTYEGQLYGMSARSSHRAGHKHEIRRVFHKQLRRYWELHPYLRVATVSHRRAGQVQPPRLLRDHLSKEYSRCGYNFVPLVTPSLSLICAVDILFLRPSLPGEVMASGDLDNRLKTIFDALRVPENQSELGGYDVPLDDEKPFYCLLSDDKLISHVSVETDTLLQPTGEKEDANDARLVIAIKLRPFDVGWDNISFG